MYRYIIRLIEILRQISIWQRAKGKRSGNKNIKIKKSGSRVKRHKHWFLMLNPVFTNNAMVFTNNTPCPLSTPCTGHWWLSPTGEEWPAVAQPWPSLPCPRSQHHPQTRPQDSGGQEIGHQARAILLCPPRLRLGRKEGGNLHFYCRLWSFYFLFGLYLISLDLALSVNLKGGKPGETLNISWKWKWWFIIW